MNKQKDSDKGFNKFVIKHTAISYILTIAIFALLLYLGTIVGALFSLIAILFFIVAFWAMYTACPHCYEFFAMKKTHSEVLESHREERKDRRNVVHYNSEGRVIGKSSVPTSKIVNVEHIRSHYKCKKCNGTQSRDSKRES